MISWVEHRENGVLIQVMNKKDVKCTIMKENVARFKLAYSSPILSLELSDDLGRVDKGRLS